MKRSPLNRKRTKPRRTRHPIALAQFVLDGRIKEDFRRNAKHLSWIREQPCAFRHLGDCNGPVQAMHVRTGTDGGTGLKPSDKWTIPGCASHHRRQHQIGEVAFEIETDRDMKKLARHYWANSPHGKE